MSGKRTPQPETQAPSAPAVSTAPPPAETPPASETQYVDEIIASARRLLSEKAALGDIKIVTAAIKEMRHAFRVFAPFRGTRKVSTFGSARTTPGDPIFALAESFARRMAGAGWMVITGGGGGVMEACQRGAGREHSFGINIRLPWEQQPNPVISGDLKLMTFRYFFTRKLFFLKEADAVTLFPGGFGTHDEGFESLTLLQTGKSKPLPLVFLDRPNGTYWKTLEQYLIEHVLRRGMISEDDLALFLVTQDVDEAVEEITRFYRVYHSSRFVRDQFVIRLQRPLPPEAVAELNLKFGDIVTRGSITQRRALPAENDGSDAADLPRLVFRFDREHFGRLRQMINRLNEF